MRLRYIYFISVGLLCFDEKFWFTIVVACILFAVAFMYIILGFSVLIMLINFISVILMKGNMLIKKLRGFRLFNS